MTVYLVGAGPGDPELLTMKAARLLRSADVVIHDRLVAAGVLEMIAPWAERIDVGKDPNGRSTPQLEINELLVDRGRRHRNVVRLKGGDPFVFGRGGEEALALQAAGVSVEVVPGISSAISAPAAAGVPVTHRGVSSAVTVVTAHEAPDTPGGVDWNALARLKTTLVVLMGARRAAAVRDRLLAGGMERGTPVVIVVSAWTPHQEVYRLTLAELGTEPVPNPAVIVVGSVADTHLLDHLATVVGEPRRPAPQASILTDPSIHPSLTGPTP